MNALTVAHPLSVTKQLLSGVPTITLNMNTSTNILGVSIPFEFIMITSTSLEQNYILGAKTTYIVATAHFQ